MVFCQDDIIVCISTGLSPCGGALGDLRFVTPDLHVEAATRTEGSRWIVVQVIGELHQRCFRLLLGRDPTHRTLHVLAGEGARVHLEVEHGIH